LKISFLEAAVCELQSAMDYYNQQKQSLGYEFLAEIKAAVGRIADFLKHGSRWQTNPTLLDSPVSILSIKSATKRY
jgi:hypothetical protein